MDRGVQIGSPEGHYSHGNTRFPACARGATFSTTTLSNLPPYTISYLQLKTQWEKLPDEIGYLGTYIPLIKHGPKGAADYMN
jgi:hypothetical protein